MITGIKSAMAAVGLGLIAMTGPARGEGAWVAVVLPSNSFEAFFAKDGKPIFTAQMMGWGPNWAWAGSPSSQEKAIGGKLKIRGLVKISEQPVQVACEAHQSGQRTVTYKYDLAAEKDVPLMKLVTAFAVSDSVTGEILVTTAGGKQQKLPIPQRIMVAPDDAAELIFKLKNVGDVVLTLDPPCRLQSENGATRVELAHDLLKAGKTTVTLTFRFPGPVSFLGSTEEQEKFTTTVAGPEWFAFKGSNDVGPSEIGFEDWLEKPAGKHGRLRMKGNQFVFEDGKPVKFWGTNLSYRDGAPAKGNADLTAARFAKWGVNAVRLHKPFGPGWEGIGDENDGTKLTASGLDQMDYFMAKLKAHGVYYGLSHTYGYRIRPGNRDRYLAYDEIAAGLGGNTYGLINFAEDVQDLLIESVIGALKHQNPYTRQRWADDPALAYIELHNEDDIFFYTTENVLAKCPTYRKDLTRRFAEWLKAKYGTQEQLATAWRGALSSGETLDARNVAVQGNPWFTGDGLPKSPGGPRVRLLDNAAFLHDVQNKFYGNFVKAIRATGYQGPLCGSPWQAPAMVPHYYNLRSDYLVGWIDRHNYFGGNFADTMLTRPGSGYLGSGLQQVADRPFGISEWIHVYPSLYSAEGPAILAAYGMGLQGWSSSYEFQSSSGRGAWNEIVGNFPWGVWNADTPTQIGQYPVLARVVMRGDVTQGPVISSRKLSLGELQQGRFSFSDKIEQHGDIKRFEGTVPPEALAAGRVVVEFTDKPESSTLPDMKKFEKDKVITSETGQLRWDCSDKGYFTVDTPGTKALVGFAEGKEQRLGSVTMTLRCPYGSLFLTAAGKHETLANAQTAIVSAVARNCNAGFRILAFDGRVLDNGKAPIMLEPVKAAITIGGRSIAAVNVLDHDGRRTGKTLDTAGGTFTIDGARDKAIYYEVVFK
ncbi:MAG: hypothetical protein ABSG53_16765 [Thermoguttaceae bacterium]